MNKKMMKVASLSTVTLALLGAGSGVVCAAEWHANTPSQIGKLNQDGTYTVKEGDTIWAIGVHFNIKPKVIEEVNHVSDPYLLKVGTVLKLHIDANDSNKATIEVTEPNGQKHEKALNQKDKIVEHKKFGENVANDITKDNGKTQAKENTSANQTKETNNQNVSNEQLAMASYEAWYGKGGGQAPMNAKSLYFSKDKDKANTYSVGSGTADSTVTFTINGNTITYCGGGNGTTPSQKGTLNRQEVINKYFSTKAQKDLVNKAISNSQAF